jgi:membrane protease YdiL (CAAX protease family)
MKRIGQDDDERRDEHRAGEEKRIDTRDKAEDEEHSTRELGVRSDVTEEDRDVIARKVGGEGGHAAVTEDFRHPVRQEDQAGGESQRERGDIGGPFTHVATIVGTTSLFVAIYLATFIASGYVARITGSRFFYWPALLAAAAATLSTVAIMERGGWRIGFIVPPRLALFDSTHGVVFAAFLIGLADLIVLAFTSMRHRAGDGFPWLALFSVYIPAAIHEEVLFRGYLFQKFRLMNRWIAIIASAFVFAVLHLNNYGISSVAIVNLVLAGVFLCLAWERFGRLWFPIGIHLGWNLASGPVLGYGVSGFSPEASLLKISGNGPWWLTGGAFGIEGSIAATVVEVIGIALVFRGRGDNV